MLPAYNGGATQDRQNIDALLRADFDPYEINMQSAENAIGGGTAGSGFAQAGRYKLLDSEKLQRRTLGHQMLQPYLGREHDITMQSNQSRDRLAEIAAQGKQAMAQLQASLAGQMAQLTEQQRAALERQILSGNQAMEQLRLSESGATERQRTGIGGQLANTVVGALLSGGGGGSGGSGTRGGISTHGFSGPGSSNAWAGSLAGTGYMTGGTEPGYMMGGQNAGSPRPQSGGSNFSTSIIQNILRQFGVR